MLLERRQVEQIIRGTKTQTRFPTGIATQYRVGSSYPVRQREKCAPDVEPTRCRVVCEVVELAPRLGDISLKDAIAEGHKTTDGFREWWVARYDPTFDGDRAQRFVQRFAAKPVICVAFKLDVSERPRFLAPAVGRGRGMGDYTESASRAMQDVGEPLDEATQKWFTADAHERALNRPGRREEALRRQGKSLSTRLKQAVQVVDPENIEAAALLERINSQVAMLEKLRRAA